MEYCHDGRCMMGWEQSKKKEADRGKAGEKGDFAQWQGAQKTKMRENKEVIADSHTSEISMREYFSKMGESRSGGEKPRAKKNCGRNSTSCVT